MIDFVGIDADAAAYFDESMPLPMQMMPRRRLLLNSSKSGWLTAAMPSYQVNEARVTVAKYKRLNERA